MSNEKTAESSPRSAKVWDTFDHHKILLSELNGKGYGRKVQEVVDNILLKQKNNPEYIPKYQDYQPHGICSMFGMPEMEGVEASAGRAMFLSSVDEKLKSEEKYSVKSTQFNQTRDEVLLFMTSRNGIEQNGFGFFVYKDDSIGRGMRKDIVKDISYEEAMSIADNSDDSLKAFHFIPYGYNPDLDKVVERMFDGPFEDQLNLDKNK